MEFLSALAYFVDVCHMVDFGSVVALSRTYMRGLDTMISFICVIWITDQLPYYCIFCL